MICTCSLRYSTTTHVYGFGTFILSNAGAFSAFVYDAPYAIYANSLLDVYTTTGVTTYEVTATAEVDVPTFNSGGYTGATGPNRTKGCKSKIYRLSIAGSTGLETATGN